MKRLPRSLALSLLLLLGACQGSSGGVPGGTPASDVPASQADAPTDPLLAGCPGPAVDPPTRLGMIATANSYPAFHVQHDGSKLRLIADVIRIENGNVTATDAQTICDNASAFLGETDMSKKWAAVTDDGWVVGFFSANELTTPTYFAGRFQVQDGLIQRFEEVVYVVDSTSHVGSQQGVPAMPTAEVDRLFGADDLAVGYVSLRKELGDTTPPGPADAALVRAAARRYLDAFVSHHADDVPLADEVLRVENHRLRGRNAEEIRTQLEAPTMSVTAIYEDSVTIDIEGDSAVAFYRFEDPSSNAMSGLPFTGQSWAATRFRVRDGLITEIESICGGIGGNRPYCGDSTPLGP